MRRKQTLKREHKAEKKKSSGVKRGATRPRQYGREAG